ncbi:MAG: class I SAM-dependent RNA methyltransferase [Mogibacterium sp.]|nr:class I SAM-dependent RNA methyltransferase [Mogibacterium sp.]
MKLELVATATFGLEAVVRREIEALGYRIIKTEDGRVTYMGDERAIAKSNLWLRCADRVYIRMGGFQATDFEQLFQQTKAIEWESIIPLEGAFPVVGGSVKSALHSVPACQKIIKKAVSMRLSEFYCRETMPETGAEYRIRFMAHKDEFLLMIDTSGAGLHKRGYRVRDVAAPMKETLAAALVQLSFYKKDRILVDPCCGSGTIPIEAALIARNIAPGLGRSFASENWDIMGAGVWKEERRLAYEAADFGADGDDGPLRITAMDIDPRAVAAARANADEAGAAEDIDIVRMDMTAWEPGAGIPKGAGKDDHVVVISNLPYGKRVGDDTGIKAIYSHIRGMMDSCPNWSFFLITSDKSLEKELGRKADRRRKLYNGTIETQFYQFHGSRPMKREVNHD